MKRILVFAIMGLGFSLPAMAQHGHHGDAKAKSVTLTGEVLDMTCFMMHPESGMGPEHAKCAKSCMAKGLAPGFLTTDGTVYLILGSDHASPNAKVAELAGKKSTITGVVYEHHGVKAIELVSVNAGVAKDAAVYTCPMDPEVRQAEPGNCPKCGMVLEKEAKK